MDNNIKDLLQQFGNIGKIAKQFQDNSESLSATGEAGAGAVKVVINGAFQVQSVELSEAFYQEDALIANELVKAAVNDALSKVMSEIKNSIPMGMGNLPLPGFPGAPDSNKGD